MADPRDLAIYIHWPYCARICPYCDFNVYKGRDNDDLVEAIIADLTYWRDWSDARNITSIHFGGGTPSLLAAHHVEKFISHIGTLWKLDKDVEIALEANPNNVTSTSWQDLNMAGVNRLSLGVQTFHDAGLALLGRDHDGATAQHALDTAMTIFTSVSLDLIFGWQGQTSDMWQEDMHQAIGRDVSHISAYQLTIEEGTAFAKAEARGQKKVVDEDASADFYDLTEAKLSAAGYDHYEVSNYAKSGHSSRHNLTYWTGGDYVGVGPGAHGRLSKGAKRYETIAAMSPKSYIENLSSQGHGMDYKEVLSPFDWAREYMLMGLRISDGLSLSRFQNISGRSLPQDTLQTLSNSGLLDVTGGKLRATPKGRLVLDRLTQDLLHEF